MSLNSVFVISLLLIVQYVSSRHVSRYHDLDEEEHELLRAAYDTPSYHEQYHEEEDMQLGKVDLLKDGLWALKAKVKELKAFDKALAANLLSTKLKMKDLLVNHMEPLKKHQHHASYTYQVPVYHAQQYSIPAPQYHAPPAVQYVPSAPQYPISPPAHYGSPSSQYGNSNNQYHGSDDHYISSGSHYPSSDNQYASSSNQYSSSGSQYGSSIGHVSSGHQYGDSGNIYGSSQYSSSSSHDPYYGN